MTNSNGPAGEGEATKRVQQPNPGQANPQGSEPPQHNPQEPKPQQNPPSGPVPSAPQAAGHPASGGFPAQQPQQPQSSPQSAPSSAQPVGQPPSGFDQKTVRQGYVTPQQVPGQPSGGAQQPYGSAPYAQPQQGNAQGFGQPHYGGYPGFDPSQQQGTPPGQYPYGPQQGVPPAPFGQQQGVAPTVVPLNPTMPWIVGGAAALGVIAVVLIGGLVWPGWFESNEGKVLDQVQVQLGVKQILTEGYQLPDVSAVTCPAGEPVVVGTTFTCSATVGGAPKQVKITVKDSDGLYEVARPS